MSQIPFKTNELIYGMPNSEYHGVSGTYSSSQLKDILDDPEVFYDKYVAKTQERVSIPAFDLGTYFHTAVLEPDLIEKECAVFEGIRRGKKWEEFKEENSDKAIITKNEHATALKIIEAAKNSQVAMGYIENGEPEVSAFVELTVDGPDIYCRGKILDKNGWCRTKVKPAKDAVKLIVKCRADCLGDNYILDLKSTTGNAKSKGKISNTVSKYSYDLSASFYCDVFSAVADRNYDTFIWTFASKDLGNCKSWTADTENMQVGRAKWKKAVCLIAEYTKRGWEFDDTLGVVGPQYFEREWLKEDETDLL